MSASLQDSNVPNSVGVRTATTKKTEIIISFLRGRAAFSEENLCRWKESRCPKAVHVANRFALKNIVSVFSRDYFAAKIANAYSVKTMNQ